MVWEIWETVRFYNMRLIGRPSPNTCRAWGKGTWRFQPTTHTYFPCPTPLHAGKGLAHVSVRTLAHTSKIYPFTISQPQAQQRIMAWPPLKWHLRLQDQTGERPVLTQEVGLCPLGQDMLRDPDFGVTEGQRQWVVTSSWSLGLFALRGGFWQEESQSYIQGKFAEI